jgi:hypothetical protein
MKINYKQVAMRRSLLIAFASNANNQIYTVWNTLKNKDHSEYRKMRLFIKSKRYETDS